jgi:hypothetical protein
MTTLLMFIAVKPLVEGVSGVEEVLSNLIFRVDWWTECTRTG